MAILINQSNNNLSGENLLASSSLENSISEARNLSIQLDQKSADLKVKADEFKQESEITLTAVFAKMDAKETALNRSADNAVNKISKSVNDLKQASDLIKSIWIVPQAIAIHVIIFLVEIGIAFWFAVPPIIEAKKSLVDNEKILRIVRERKQENERLALENQELNDFILFLSRGNVEKARKAFADWKSNK
ncbi:hypothetical protein H7R39_06975 [Campylobacter sp. Marseille-Q3452]|uniref:Uncharacterized protein n=1 Tax=Campylobacter massiliensis TaxID=2762557 RepID=A0A842J5R1_9BACT|nr:hypothetical protein [Campylobacter massiliensis]MBC2883001.1 hypothetical protein [Campylobacter massiliensis]